MFNSRTIVTALATASLALSAASALAGPQEDIQRALDKVLPGVEVNDVQPSPVDGVYEVSAGGDLMYVTGDGRYFLTGHIVDLKTKEDLTEPRLAQARLKLINSIDEDQMVVFSPAKPRHTVTVFTDIDCSYCRKLHSQIDAYNDEGIRVRYLFFPRAGKGSKSYDEAVSVWCAGDAQARRTALTDAKKGQSIANKTCENPVDQHMAVAEQIGLRGTPAIITEQGDMIPGYVAPKRLIAELNKAD